MIKRSKSAIIQYGASSNNPVKKVVIRNNTIPKTKILNIMSINFISHIQIFFIITQSLFFKSLKS